MQSLDKRLSFLLIIALVGVSSWFFGNLYEYIVLFPNLMFLSGLEGLIAFRQFFVYSNPAFYYIIGWFGLISLFDIDPLVIRRTYVIPYISRL